MFYFLGRPRGRFCGGSFKFRMSSSPVSSALLFALLLPLLGMRGGWWYTSATVISGGGWWCTSETVIIGEGRWGTSTTVIIGEGLLGTSATVVEGGGWSMSSTILACGVRAATVGVKTVRVPVTDVPSTPFHKTVTEVAMLSWHRGYGRPSVVGRAFLELLGKTGVSLDAKLSASNKVCDRKISCIGEITGDVVAFDPSKDTVVHGSFTKANKTIVNFYRIIYRNAY